MIILRVLLYLTCIFSIGWSVLIFGGPAIIKKLVVGYSNGALIPSDVTISPTLDISISRLEFNLQNEIAGYRIEGFSRAAEIAWSLFSEKPFLEINVGPSAVKGSATVESATIYTPSLQEIDWQNIAFITNIDTLSLNSFSKMNSLSLAGNLNLGSGKVSNVRIVAEGFSAQYERSDYSAHLMRGDLSELNFNVPLQEQLFSSTFAIENITVSDPNLTVSESIVEISVDEKAKNFKFDLFNLILPELGGSVENLKVDGYFNHSNVLQELMIASRDSMPFKKLPRFPEILVTVKKLGDKQYRANIEGNLQEFEISDSDNFIGSLPSANFVIDAELDRATSKLTSISEIHLTPLSVANIVGSVEMKFRSELLTKFKCALADCELYDFDLSYKINFDEEWLMGNAACAKSFCSFKDMDHFVKTSNTVNIFTILNKAKILNPLTSLYIYSAITSGRKINDGHELKF